MTRKELNERDQVLTVHEENSACQKVDQTVKFYDSRRKSFSQMSENGPDTVKRENNSQRVLSTIPLADQARRSSLFCSSICKFHIPFATSRASRRPGGPPIWRGSSLIPNRTFR
jgi:hypothetical protein